MSVLKTRTGRFCLVRRELGLCGNYVGKCGTKTEKLRGADEGLRVVKYLNKCKHIGSH